MLESIESAALHEIHQERYLNYALSVITSRALPDVRDGLKPVQRRILYAMFHNLRLMPEAKHRKSAAVVGEVMAKYHPHGDQSIYDAMVRLAQPFAVRYPLVDGQGNFGSVDGDGAAAMRYTEARLRHVAVELLSELKKETVDSRLNYDGTINEPVVLPAQVPNLLINGASGIAVGMATHIPPHNLGEVVDALIALVDKPDLDLDAIVGPIIRGPDFPTGGQILTGRDELLEFYQAGRGTIGLRGEWELEQDGHKKRIIVTSIPYGLNKSSLIGDVAELIRKARLPQLTDVRDESTEDVRIVLELKRNADPEAAMAYLFKRTGLQSRFAVNMTALCPIEGSKLCQPRRLDLLSILHHFLTFRFDVTTRRLQYDLSQLEKRIHLLEAFVAIFNSLDEAIGLIRSSESKADARSKLMKRFELDWDQAEAILETKLYRLAKLEIESLRAELREKEAEAADLRTTLSSDTLTWALIRSELVSIRDAYSDPRRSKVTGPVEEVSFSVETYIVDEDTFVMVSRGSWFKRQKSYSDLTAVRVREGDEIGWVLPCSTRETIVFFTDRGRAYTMRVSDVTQTTGYGEPLQTRFDFADGEHVVGVTSSDSRCHPILSEEVLSTDESEPTPPFAVALSRGGKSLRISIESYLEPSTRSGRLFMRLDSSFRRDGVVGVTLSDGEEICSLASRNGRFLLFDVDQINVLSGPGKGVLAIKLDFKDYVMGFKLVKDKMDGLTVRTSRGRLETLRPNKFQVTKRGNRGRELIKVGHLVEVLREPDEIVYVEPEPDEEEITEDASIDWDAIHADLKAAGTHLGETAEWEPIEDHFNEGLQFNLFDDDPEPES